MKLTVKSAVYNFTHRDFIAIFLSEEYEKDIKYRIIPELSFVREQGEHQSNKKPYSQWDQKWGNAVNHQKQNQSRDPESPIQQFLSICQHDQQEHSRHNQKDGHVNSGG